MIRDAYISDDGRMRYWLSRDWAQGPNYPVPLVFILLNPSDADAYKDDPTVRKCVKFAKRLGHSQLFIVNLFPFRATDPRALKAAGYPNDKTNDDTIGALCHGAKVICGWGAHGRDHPRGAAVLNYLREAGNTPFALRLLADGTPGHPLYLPDNSELVAVPR